MTTLEVLYEARQRLEGKPYKYADWSSCTCGHIYAAATGKRGTETAVAAPDDTSYIDALLAVIKANALSVCADSAAIYDRDARALAVSSATSALAVKEMFAVDDDHELTDAEAEDCYRAGALKLVNSAIFALEAEQEQARLDVLAQAEAVVNAAELDPVPA